MNRKFYFNLFSALVLAFLAMAAPSSSQNKPDWKERWGKTLADAKKEAKVVVFGPPGELIRQAFVEGFKKAYPDIQLEFSSARSGEQAVKLQAERDAGVYSVDVFVGGPTTANFQLKPMGALDPIRPSLILPDVADLKNWRDNRLEFSDKESLYDLVFGIEVSPPVIYDSRQVKRDEVAQVHDLLNPKWKGKIVLNDPSVSGASVPLLRFIWVTLGPEKATDYYRKLKEQTGAVDRDLRRQIEWVAQSKYPILVGPSPRTAGQLLKRGLKFEFLPEFKDIGGMIGSSSATVMKLNKAPHPNAAAVFINWLLSTEGQTLWSRATDQLSLRMDVPKDHVPAYLVPSSKGRYWKSYTEEAQTRTPEEEKILKELFAR
ncbi:MAG: extracellular solute-binding protein [Candidatus Binatia bacterium]